MELDGGANCGVYNYAKLTITGGTIYGEDQGIKNRKNNSNPELYLKGNAKVTSDGEAISNEGYAEISGDVVITSKERAIDNELGKLIISGGEITSNKYAIYNYANLIVTGGKISVTGEYSAICNYSGGVLEIADKAELVGEAPYWGTVYNIGKLTVTGGIIDGGEDGAVLNNAYEDDDGTIIIGEATISGGEISSNNIGIYNYGKLNVTGGKISSVEAAINNNAYESDSGTIITGDVTISGGEFITENAEWGTIYNDGKLNVAGGIINGGQGYGIYNNAYEEDTGTIITGEATILAGEITSNNYGIYNIGKLTATGGTITGTNYAIYNDSSEQDSGTILTGQATVSTDSVTINGNTNL